mmetsp:Transcript_54361/g.172685  ORF Transcript_54361/g.172685 Transcript_54361/m.172685 type:complete len:541 (-) Transcript_54361:237-1859(-)
MAASVDEGVIKIRIDINALAKNRKFLIGVATTVGLVVAVVSYMSSGGATTTMNLMPAMGFGNKFKIPSTNRLLSVLSNTTAETSTDGQQHHAFTNPKNNFKVYSLGRGKMYAIDDDLWHASEPEYEQIVRDWTRIPERGPFVANLPGRDAQHGIGASSILGLPDGSVVAAWSTGDPGRRSSIQVSRLGAFDPRKWEGTTWSEPQQIESISSHDPVYKSYRGMGSPALIFDAHKGRVHLFFTAFDPARGLISAMPMRCVSLDMGKTWDWPQMLFPGAKTQWGSALLMYGEVVRSNPFVASDGRWIVPMYHSPGGTEGALVGKADPEMEYSAIKWTADEGITWGQINLTLPGQQLVEPTVIPLRKTSFFKHDHNLIAFFRDRGARSLRFSVSVDEGASWGKLNTMLIPNADNAFAALSLASGAIVLVFENWEAGPACTPLSVALSDDGGWTWPFVRDLERGNCVKEKLDQAPFHGVRNPSATQTPDGAIHITYSHTVLGAKSKGKHGLQYGPSPIPPGIKYLRIGGKEKPPVSRFHWDFGHL